MNKLSYRIKQIWSSLKGSGFLTKVAQYKNATIQTSDLPKEVKDKLKKWDSLSPKEKEELRRKFKTQ